MELLDLFFSSSNSDVLKEGDWVYVIPYGCYGTIVDIIGDEYYVDIDDEEDEEDSIEIFTKSDLSKK